MARLKPFRRDVQAHYDLSNAFFALFLDRSLTYSCALFDRGSEMSLEDAQRAKIDLALRKCRLAPGQRLLDIGCGWGATVRRAVEAYHVSAVGLTLSRNQHEYASRLFEDVPHAEIRLQGWEDFDERVDRIVSIGAFEHFRAERYEAFFARCMGCLGPDGRMLLQTIVRPDVATLEQRGLRIEHEDVLFAKFIGKRIFPGGQLCPPETVVSHARRAGFELLEQQSLQPHYARTLERWAANLRGNREWAVPLVGEETYEVYMRYLSGCAGYFRSGHLDVVQFTLEVSRG